MEQIKKISETVIEVDGKQYQAIEVEQQQPKAPKWEDLGSVSGSYITELSNIHDYNEKLLIEDYSRNIFPTHHHAEAALAEAQLLQLRDSKFYRNGWKPDYLNDEQVKYTVEIGEYGKLCVDWCCTRPKLFSFQDEETAKHFLNEQSELLEIWSKKFD